MLTAYVVSFICGLWATASVLASPNVTAVTCFRDGSCLNAFGPCVTGPCLAAFTVVLPTASKYCSSYLNTVINPVTALAITKATTTITPARSTITAPKVTTIQTISKVFTTTITTGGDKVKARDLVLPTFASLCTSINELKNRPSEVSSACSCLVVNTPPVTTETKTTTLTATAATTISITTLKPTTTSIVTVFTSTVWVYVGSDGSFAK